MVEEKEFKTLRRIFWVSRNEVNGSGGSK